MIPEAKMRQTLNAWAAGLTVAYLWYALSADIRGGTSQQGECVGCGHEGKVTRRFTMCQECCDYIWDKVYAS